MDLAEQIKRIMLDKGMTQKALAEKLGVKQPRISEALGDRRDTYVATLIAIAEALDCDVVLKPRK
jgi:transcriptional regulator with XRE-family HTH domain